MRHVALVIPQLDCIGGAESQVVQMASGLLLRGWHVSMVALAGSGGVASRKLTAAGASFLSLEMRKGLLDPRGWLRFHHWLRRERPDLVHAHLPHAVWMARWSRLFAPVPVLIDTIHTSAIGSLGRRIGYRVSNWLPDHTCAVSEDAADAYRSSQMVSVHRLTVIPNAVDVNLWHPDTAHRNSIRKRLGLTDEFLWCAVGRLDPVKDYPSLMRAMVDLGKAAHLVIAGDGAQESELHRLIAELRLERRVTLLGFQSDVRPWVQSADGFVLSSRWEGLPTSLLEAGACGVPAVATAVAGSREVIVHGRTGFLAASGNVDALRNEMLRLMQISSEDRENMGQNARRHIVQHFSSSSSLDRWESLYLELLNKLGSETRVQTSRTAHH